MTERALKLINMVLTHEGGYSSGNEKQTKGDKGKETYCGISRVYNPNWDGWKIIDRHKPIKYNAKIKDSKLEASVKQYYYTNYYYPLKCEQFTSLLIAGHLFCHAVNAGIKTSAKLLQKAINNVYKVNITVDGIVGCDVEIVYIRRTCPSLGDKCIIGIGRRSHFYHIAKQLGFLHRLLCPYASIEVCSLVDKEVVRYHTEFKRGTTTKENHGIAFRHLKELLYKSYSFVNYRLEILCTMAYLHQGKTRTLKV